MGKKKGIAAVCVCICVLLAVAGLMLLHPKENHRTEKQDKLVTLEEAKTQFEADIQELKNGAYANLIVKDFTASIEDAKGLYHFQILRNQTWETTLENVDEMTEALELFFGEKLDKSELYHRVYTLDENGKIPKDAIGTEISFDEVMALLRDETKKGYSLSGGFVLDGDMYAHLDPAFGNTWFSKRSLGTSLPGDEEHTKEYLYVTGIRQTDGTVHLQDREYQLSELEKQVLDYVNGEDFPLPQQKELSYQIGTVHVIEAGEQECINFVLRRVYQGIPFEYGSASASGAYRDELKHEYTSVNYVEGTQPDTIMGFMDLKGTVEEIKEITELITAGKALRLLSEKIGENSIYEVYGVELVYRNSEMEEDKFLEISDILEPKWKIITLNQNDDKYTLFYVDVVTGEITDRFEYWYD